MRIGAHMSAAGGVARAVERAVLHGCEALQVFTKNNARWVSKPIAPDEARRFRESVAAAGLRPVVSHASYLINMAAPDSIIRRKSIEGLKDELARASMLGLLGVVVHPGVAWAGCTESQAIDLVAASIREAFASSPRDETMILIEHTAGQGRTIGHCFEHLAAIVDRVDGAPRLGVCLDTCHLLASGYDITTAQGYQDTFDRFSRLVGLERLRMFHANDSKRPCGSRVDRHEHIGKGYVGLEAFRRLLADARFADLGMAIETEKTRGICDNPRVIARDPLDGMNLDALRALRAS